MTNFTFTMSEEQARRLHLIVSSECSALKNHTASAVERGDLSTAQQHVSELRALQALYAATNIDAKYTISKYSDKELLTVIQVQDTRRI